jgi:AcrR family transcriptional regulator
MVETKRKRLPAAERRAVIVEAAGRLFGDRGYDGARLDEIAAAAGVTKPILYRHFADKDALYLALLERHRDDLPTFAAAIEAEGPPEQRLRAVLDLWFAYAQSRSYAWQMLFRDSGGGPRIRAYRNEVHARARAVLIEIIRAQTQTPIPDRELEPLAELLSMGMASLVLRWIDEPALDREAIVDAMTRVWAAVLTAEVGTAQL